MGRFVDHNMSHDLSFLSLRDIDDGNFAGPRPRCFHAARSSSCTLYALSSRAPLPVRPLSAL